MVLGKGAKQRSKSYEDKRASERERAVLVVKMINYSFILSVNQVNNFTGQRYMYQTHLT